MAVTLAALWQVYHVIIHTVVDLPLLLSIKGDQRVNEQPNLLVHHTLWAREHNRIARELKKLNPHWKDEILYQVHKKVLSIK